MISACQLKCPNQERWVEKVQVRWCGPCISIRSFDSYFSPVICGTIFQIQEGYSSISQWQRQTDKLLKWQSTLKLEADNSIFYWRWPQKLWPCWKLTHANYNCTGWAVLSWSYTEYILFRGSEGSTNQAYSHLFLPLFQWF